MRRVTVLFTAAISMACSGSETGPSDDFVLPAIPVIWSVEADTSRLFPNQEIPKFVNISTIARDLANRITLGLGCSYSYGDAISNGLPINRAVSIDISPSFFSSQFPLVVNSWRPSLTSDPQVVWQVPTSNPFVAFLSDAYRAVFWEAVKGKIGLQLYWSESGSRVERNFDIRLLGAALNTIDAICHR